jgi:hypothetical protein
VLQTTKLETWLTTLRLGKVKVQRWEKEKSPASRRTEKLGTNFSQAHFDRENSRLKEKTTKRIYARKGKL